MNTKVELNWYSNIYHWNTTLVKSYFHKNIEEKYQLYQ